MASNPRTAAKAKNFVMTKFRAEGGSGSDGGQEPADPKSKQNGQGKGEGDDNIDTGELTSWPRGKRYPIPTA